MSETTSSCEIQIRVRYPEADRMGAVHHSRYWVYFEMGRIELLRASGISYADVEADGVFLVVAKASADFRAPAHYDDVLTLRTRVAKVGQVRIDHEYELLRESDGVVIAEARTTIASVSRDGKIVPIPQAVRDACFVK